MQATYVDNGQILNKNISVESNDLLKSKKSKEGIKKYPVLNFTEKDLKKLQRDVMKVLKSRGIDCLGADIEEFDIIYSSIMCKLSKSIPVPSTTHVSGLSAINTGTFNSCDNKSSKPLIIAPPPVRTIPLSIISEDNSGGVCSNIPLTA